MCFNRCIYEYWYCRLWLLQFDCFIWRSHMSMNEFYLMSTCLRTLTKSRFYLCISNPSHPLEEHYRGNYNSHVCCLVRVMSTLRSFHPLMSDENVFNFHANRIKRPPSTGSQIFKDQKKLCEQPGREELRNGLQTAGLNDEVKVTNETGLLLSLKCKASIFIILHLLGMHE